MTACEVWYCHMELPGFKTFACWAVRVPQFVQLCRCSNRMRSRPLLQRWQLPKRHHQSRRKLQAAQVHSAFSFWTPCLSSMHKPSQLISLLVQQSLMRQHMWRKRTELPAEKAVHLTHHAYLVQPFSITQNATARPCCARCAGGLSCSCLVIVAPAAFTHDAMS